VPAYLQNAWYVAAFSDEITRRPLGRTLLDKPMVFFRKESGEPVALFDRCPHRFAPLSLGTVVGDQLQCSYHGLRFDGDGRCVFNPHRGSAPAAARVDSYRLAERYGFIWLWPGDPAKANPALIPDYDYLEKPDEFSLVRGLLYIRGNYQLVVDNLLDLSHAPYLHPHFAMTGVTPDQQLAATKTRLDRHDDRITAYRLRTGLPPNQATCDLFGFSQDPVDTRSNMTWYPPALLDFDLGSCAPGANEREGLCMPQAHCVTPETETTSHYFFVAARNMRLNDPQVDEKLREIFDRAFRTQDEPMIEAVQARMGATGDIQALQPVLLSSDGPPVAARRLLSKLLALESGQVVAADPLLSG